MFLAKFKSARQLAVKPVSSTTACQTGRVPVITFFITRKATTANTTPKTARIAYRPIRPIRDGRTPNPLQTGQKASALPQARPEPLHGGHIGCPCRVSGSCPVPWHFLQIAWYFPHALPVPPHGEHFMILPSTSLSVIARLRTAANNQFHHPSVNFINSCQGHPSKNFELPVIPLPNCVPGCIANWTNG